ncbi:MAG: agmatine deiminase family protein [Candidatus Margulisiibacteriota bacterium]
MKKIVLLLILSVFTFSTLALVAEGVGSLKLEADKMEQSYRSQKVAGRVFHTFTLNDVRNQTLSFSPQFYMVLSPEALSKIFSEYQNIYGLEIKTVKTGIFSEKDMARYLVESGVAKELGLDQAAILKALKKIDWRSHYLKPRGQFTRYYIDMPPAAPVRLPAMFEPAGAVYVSWPIYEGWVWRVHAELVREIEGAAQAWVLVPDEYWQKAVELYLTKKKIDLSKVKFLHIPTDDAWARNWGQVTIFSGKDKSPAFVQEHYVGYAYQPFAKKSATAAAALAGYLDVPLYQLPLVLEQGGNIISDGNGTIVSTTRVFEQNPDVSQEQYEKILKDYYGCKRLIVIPRLKNEVNGHADFIKFADAHTVFVCSAPKDSLWHDALEKTARIFSKTKSLDGQPYKVVRIPLPTNFDHGKDGRGYNYNCGLMVNKKMLVPTYGAPEDEEALKIYRETLPGYEVVGIDYTPYLAGAINCQTVELPLAVTKGR